MSEMIALSDVSKTYANGVAALESITLTAEQGEFVVLVGPSGCGKSTLLRIVAGLDEPTGGEVRIGGSVANGLSPRARDVAMVFQSYALYPHMTVAENMAFGLRLRRRPKQEIRARVAEAAAILGLADLLDRRPATLSGGQRQRVAMGRAIVRRPKAFLMDEPLSNLDAQLRVTMRGELRRLHQSLGITTLYVTHDQVEAMTLGDRVAVLSQGTLQQIGSPTEIFQRPANLFVARFIGSPPMNLLRLPIRQGSVRIGDASISVPRAVRAREVIAGIRPSAFRDAASAPTGSLAELEVTADVVEHLGEETHVLFSLGDAMRAAQPGEDEGLDRLLTACVDPRTRVAPGEPLRLAFDPQSVHFFDKETGNAI